MSFLFAINLRVEVLTYLNLYIFMFLFCIFKKPAQVQKLKLWWEQDMGLGKLNETACSFFKEERTLGEKKVVYSSKNS